MRSVEVKGVGGDVENALLQVLEVADAHAHVTGFGVADNKITEPEVVHDCLAEVYGQFF